ncbi:AraC family transcriptional regulator [Shewanella sp. Isolate11]|uniref:helix-turn-helix transcriptional regulator n=1 Tax=Shewanella sp. Isolate11 TaxID=2908530 RepID=UPI001EFE9923|nr:AraC family transcriptional regulator [Shewanella sp. Isolate11]MCG9697864.1 AraC family transcriptional regulator [Shewanella sp. Isolate11]
MYLVRSGAVDQFENTVLEMGQNPIKILLQAGLSQAQLRDPNTYIAYPRLAELLELAAQQCQQPLFGAKLAQQQTLKALGDLPMLVSRSATVADALSKVNEYLYLHASGAALELQSQQEHTRLVLDINIYSPLGSDQLMQMSIAQLAIFTAGLLNIDAHSFILHLNQQKPLQLNSDDLIGLPTIRFNEKFNGIVLKNTQLASKNHQNEEALSLHLQNHLRYLQSQYPDNLVDQTRDLINHLLPTGECRIEQVALALNLHQRSLQTRLKQQHQSYRSLLQQVRQDLAQQLLSRNSQTITEIALQLGYAEVAVFSRHFRSWFGQSPRQWRQAHLRK